MCTMCHWFSRDSLCFCEGDLKFFFLKSKEKIQFFTFNHVAILRTSQLFESDGKKHRLSGEGRSDFWNSGQIQRADGVFHLIQLKRTRSILPSFPQTPRHTPTISSWASVMDLDNSPTETHCLLICFYLELVWIRLLVWMLPVSGSLKPVRMKCSGCSFGWV